MISKFLCFVADFMLVFKPDSWQSCSVLRMADSDFSTCFILCMSKKFHEGPLFIRPSCLAVALWQVSKSEFTQDRRGADLQEHELAAQRVLGLCTGISRNLARMISPGTNSNDLASFDNPGLAPWRHLSVTCPL